MAGSIANLILKIFSQKGEATKDVEELAVALDALDHTKAEATAQVDTDKTKFEQLELELKAFDHKTVKAKATVETDTSQLGAFERSLRAVEERSHAFGAGQAGQFTSVFPGQGQVKVPVDLDATRARAQALALNKELKAELHDQHINVDVDRAAAATSAIQGLETAFGALSTAGAGVGAALGGLFDNIGKVSVNMGMFGFTLGPVILLVLGLAVAIGVSLVAALAAVAASAVLAATALGALGIAFAGAVLPIAVIAIPAVILFSRVLGQLKAAQQQQARSAADAAQAAQQKAQADNSARQYAESHADAERALSSAVQAAADAQKQAYREMQDAIEAVADAYRALQHAQLNVQQSALNIDKDKQAIKDFRAQVGLAGKEFDAMFKTFTTRSFDPSKLNKALASINGPGATISPSQTLDLRQLILNLKDDYLNQKDAVNGVHDATVNLTRAQQDAAPFIQNGISASKSYQAALKGVADAQRNLNRLAENRAFELQQQDALKAAKASDAATRSVRGLTGESLKLFNALKALGHAFMEAVGPAVNALIDGVVRGLGSLVGAIGNMKGPLTTLGKAMGDAIANFFKVLSSKHAQDLFLNLINGATQLVPLIGQIFAPMLDLLTKIAVAAMPFLVDAFKSIAGWMESIDKKTTLKDIHDFIQKIIPNLNKWVSLALALVPAFFDFIIAIAPYGLQFLDWVKKTAVQFGKWVESKKGREEIKNFFDKTIPTAIQFFKSIVFLTKGLVDLVTWIQHAAGSIGDFFSPILDFFGNVYDAITTVTSLLTGLNPFQLIIDALGSISIIADTIKWANIGIDIITGVIKGLQEIDFKKFVVDLFVAMWQGVKDFLGIGSPSKLFHDIGSDIIHGLWNGIRSVAFSIRDWLVPKIDAAINFLAKLPGKFFNLGWNIIRSLWSGVRSVAFSVKDWVVGRFNDAIGALKGFWTTFYDVGSFLIKGLWSGIKSVGFSIKDFVKGKINDVKNFLEGHSPSRLMMRIGRDVGLGFEIGINATGARVSHAAMRSLATPVVAAATSVGGGAGGGITIQHQSVNLPAAPGFDQMGDPRHQAAQFAREMRRRGWR